MSILKEKILADIRRSGPMSVAAYMGAALFDREHGFYATRDPLAVDGDFITAPEVSQMFGECLGAWVLQTWADMGAPDPVQLIELGPGRGTLMSDLLRVARLKPDFLKAARVTLVEASPALEGKQAEVLASSPVQLGWAPSLADCPPGPAIIIGNEFLDCLPIRQAVKQDGRWHERVITEDPDNDGKLIFALAPDPLSQADLEVLPAGADEAEDGALAEFSPGIAQLCLQLAERFKASPGHALFIDYGYDEPVLADTFQALAKHTKVPPLASPGEADLTAQVDFATLSRTATSEELSVAGPVSQARFLQALGLELRAAALSKAAPDSAPKLARQMRRLMHRDEMGTLFKAICLSDNSLSTPFGFDR